MNDLVGAAGKITATIHITRKATGKVETYELVGAVDEAALAALINQGNSHGSSGALTGPESKLEGK